MVNSISPLDYYSNNIDPAFDFNNDGKVDISDYNYAISQMADVDSETYENYTKEQLDSAFGQLISNAKDANDAEINESNAEEIGKRIVTAVESGQLDPTKAATLNQLQDIGRTLTKYIKQSADITKLLATKMDAQKKELEEIEEEKEVKTIEYKDKEAEVNTKSEELSAKMIEIINASNNLSNEQQKIADATIKQCVEDYKNGKYPGQALYTVIEAHLGAKGCGFNISRLHSLLNSSEALGEEIKSICSSIDNLVGNIKSITEKYNAKNTEYNSTLGTRNSVLQASAKAAQQYQSGYQQRLDMRTAIINKYHVNSAGGDKAKSTNPQVQMLNDFLNNKELDNMPFADAWNILTNTFDDCGIKYNDKTGAISVPYGHDAAAKNIYNELIAAMKRNYGLNADQYEDQEEEFDTGDDNTPNTGGVTGTTRNDPISFTNGNIKYEFINDANANGVMDDMSEFLGASKGWEEMKAFDADGDGIISGDELKALKMVAINQENGQYSFMSADEAGISSIDLSTYNAQNKKEINNNITVGTFYINMKDGQRLTGTQSDDTLKNLNNNYTNIFGAKIDNLDKSYEENPFMENFVETTNTKKVTQESISDIKKTEQNAANILKMGENKVENKVSTESAIGTAEKKLADEKAEREEKIQTEKEEQKKAEEKEAQKKAEEKEAEEKETEEAKKK